MMQGDTALSSNRAILDRLVEPPVRVGRAGRAAPDRFNEVTYGE